MNELDTSCERDIYELFLFLVVCEQARDEMWISWAWTLWDKNISLSSVKNSAKKFIHKKGKDGNEL
jgi:hypothetical protein